MLKVRTINILFLATLAFFIIYERMATLPILAFGLLVLAYLAIQAYGSAVLSTQFFLPVRCKGDKHSNAIALTFDDGPIPGQTEKILDILKLYEVPAAFFCIGSRVADHPGLAKRIYEGGHILGNHSYWHGMMFDLQTAERIGRELADTDDVIQRVIGVKPNFFRPPYGVSNPMVARAVRKGGYKTIGWTIRSFDTLIKSPVALMNRVTKSLKAGDVILFHDNGNTTHEILPALLDHLSKLGLKIVRLDELLNEKAYA
jgi:peptidoglycan/xylan/chitin deacetylase (PgdA/CDA1 family)